MDEPRGTVSLQTIPDRSIQATHPINLEPALLARILNGIHVQDKGDRLFQRLVAGPSSPVSAFSDEQIQFLAPLLAEGLRTASPVEEVVFEVRTLHEGSLLESSWTETTSGSLYAFGRQLSVTLSEYRESPVKTNINIRNINYQSVGMDYSGLKNRALLFYPSEAQRSDGLDPPEGGKSTDRFLAIDYELLQHPPSAVATVGQTTPQAVPAGTSQATEQALAKREAEIQALRDRVNKNASEMETLRKELQSVQEQLGSPTTAPDSQKRKTSPSTKP